MRKLLNNKGHSLIEMIISFAVMSLLLTALFMICSTTYGTIEKNRHDVHADTMLDNVADYIKNTTGKTCDDLLVFEIPPTGFNPDFSTVNGADCYALAFYNGKLYDFGKVTGTAWSSLTSSINNYRAFNDEYYNNTQLAIGFERRAGSSKWAEITLCAHRNGNRVTRNRIINYNMLNNSDIIFNGDANNLGILINATDDVIQNTDILMIYYNKTT